MAQQLVLLEDLDGECICTTYDEDGDPVICECGCCKWANSLGVEFREEMWRAEMAELADASSDAYFRRALTGSEEVGNEYWLLRTEQAAAGHQATNELIAAQRRIWG